MKTFSSITVLFVIVFISSCSSRNEKIEIIKEDKVISSSGKYIIANFGLTLNVSTRNKLLLYNVVDKDGKIIIEPNDNISAYQKWFLFWDNNTSYLWLWSSDIGGCVWKRDSLNYKQMYLDFNDSINKNIPSEYYNNLPSSIRKNLH